MVNSEEFYNNFMRYAKANDKIEANAVLMRELGRILVEDRDNFIYVLRHATIAVPDNASDIDLINLFIRNIPKNKTLLLGSAFLLSTHNKMVGFDGEQYTSNICANAIQKSMHHYFSGPVYSNAEGVVGAIAGALGEGAKFGQQVSANKAAKQANSPMALLAKQQAAKAQLTQSVIDQKTKALEQTQQTEKSKRTKVVVIGVISGVAFLALGVGLYLKYGRKK